MSEATARNNLVRSINGFYTLSVNMKLNANLTLNIIVIPNLIIVFTDATQPALLFSMMAFCQDNGKFLEADLRGKQCRGGSGICSTVSDSLNRNQNTGMKNFRAIRTSPRSLTLELDATALSKDEQVKFFGKEYSNISSNEQLTFVQEEDYEFTLEILLYLDLDIKYRYLRKGEYPVKIISDTALVFLTLTD